MLRRSITYVLAPAALGALLLVGMIEIGAAYLKGNDSTLDVVEATISPEPPIVLALQALPADTMATASTSEPLPPPPPPPPLPPSPPPPASSAPPPVLTLTGPYTVVDGRTLSAGEIAITLAGIEAPEARAVCVDLKRRQWACGRQARAALTKLVQQRSLRCRPVPDLGGRPIPAECSAGDEDLARTLVRQGWARPTGDGTGRFQREIETARRARTGLWNGNWSLVSAASAESARSGKP